MTATELRLRFIRKTLWSNPPSTHTATRHGQRENFEHFFIYMFGIGKKKEEVKKDASAETVTKSVATKATPAVDADAKPKKETLMGKLLADTQMPPNAGDIVEGKVIAIDKKGVFVDLPPFGTGVIFGREYLMARDVIKKMAIGDTISAKVVEAKNADGYIELSLKEARQALIWSDAETAIAAKTIFERNSRGFFFRCGSYTHQEHPVAYCLNNHATCVLSSEQSLSFTFPTPLTSLSTEIVESNNRLLLTFFS